MKNKVMLILQGNTKSKSRGKKTEIKVNVSVKIEKKMLCIDKQG
jgi:hypothetical protein